MTLSPEAKRFTERYGGSFISTLGAGVDGVVLLSDRRTAVKFFTDPSRFARELEVYQLLLIEHITEIAGHAVPLLMRADKQLHAIEMTIVSPPFLLDFAAAKFEYDLPDFEEHVWEDHLERVREKFDDRWQDALAVADAFTRATGYVLLDLHLGNIRFE